LGSGSNRVKSYQMKLMAFAAVSGVAFVLGSALGDKMELKVKIVDRQAHDTNYTYFVPAQFTSRSNSNANCFGTDATVSCSGPTTTNGTATPAMSGSFNVKGATFSLQLPDGRIAVVNCDSKFAEHFAGRAGNHRDCRVPLIDDIDVEFDGDKAKLKWPVSIDGKKIESETYKILGILNKP
jgi:hypothetical protein